MTAPVKTTSPPIVTTPAATQPAEGHAEKARMRGTDSRVV
jgi:hypothetical protein